MLFSQSSHAPGPLSKPLGFKMRAMNGLAQYVGERVSGRSYPRYLIVFVGLCVSKLAGEGIVAFFFCFISSFHVSN